MLTKDGTVLMHRLKFFIFDRVLIIGVRFFLLMIIDLINIFLSPSIIDIGPNDIFVVIGAHL
jgi:hypothetical protein